ncbi:hypothetical protein ACWDCO_17360 [Streptomyces albogriseolus]
MLNSLRRALNTQSLALWTAGVSVTGNTTLAALTGLDVRLGYFLLLAAVTSGALAVAGPGAGNLIAYVAASGLCGISLWAGLLPTAVVVLGRVVRRATDALPDRRDRTQVRRPPGRLAHRAGVGQLCPH